MTDPFHIHFTWSQRAGNPGSVLAEDSCAAAELGVIGRHVLYLGEGDGKVGLSTV